MNKEQLFDALGEVDGRYVQEARQKPARRPGRKVWIAAAACLVLLLAAWPVYRLTHPAPVLHDYTLVEGGFTITLTDYNNDAVDSGGADDSGDPGPDSDVDGALDNFDHSVQREDLSLTDWSIANAVYQRLTALLWTNPEWLGGFYFDSHYSDHVARLVVLIVEEYDTKEFELELLDRAGGEVVFGSAKYSRAHLLALQEQVCDQLYALGLSYGCGLDEETNRLDLALNVADEEALALLARLDPDGDAIQVQIFSDAKGKDLAILTYLDLGEDDSDLDGDPGGYAP